MNKKDRQAEIHDKGFNMSDPTKYSKMKTNGKSLNDPRINLETILNKSVVDPGDKASIITAIDQKDYKQLRLVSQFYFDTEGIYHRMCEYLAYLFRYDYYVISTLAQKGKKGKDENKKIQSQFHNVLSYLDKSNLKNRFRNISLTVVKDGVYYGYKVDDNEKITLQDLPADYCRSRFVVNGKPVVEFNMKYFEETFRDNNYREKILKVFPKEFAKGYDLYKKGLLPPETMGDSAGWYMLDPQKAVKFNLNGSDVPYLVSCIPSIIDLKEARDLEKKKMLQQLAKIIIQKLPIDKNGDLVFDIDEAKDLHNNAVAMLESVIGADVLTTFADISVEDMDTTSATTVKSDSLTKFERTLFDNSGFAKSLFNADGNLSLDKSITNDEAISKTFVYQFQEFLNDAISIFNNKPKQVVFSVKILETTIYNYKDLAKLYKEQVQLGYSKLLPQIALGHTQSEILSTLEFENEILKINDLMVPAQMSSTQSNKDKVNSNKTSNNNNQNIIEDEKTPGRKELPDDQKSDKTIANRESMS